MVTDASVFRLQVPRLRAQGFNGLHLETGTRRGSLSDRIPSSTHAFVFWSFGDFTRELKPVKQVML